MTRRHTALPSGTPTQIPRKRAGSQRGLDNPLMQGTPCVSEPSSGQPAIACAASNDDWLQHPFYNVPNFHRVVVHGSTFPLEWLKLTINPRASAPNGPTAFGPFNWQRMTQPSP